MKIIKKRRQRYDQANINTINQPLKKMLSPMIRSHRLFCHTASFQTTRISRLFSSAPPISSTESRALPPTDKKRLDIAIVGAPNAGKSQLLNVLINSAVAAVSRKRHTTREGILGARTIDKTQLVFVDTPGFLNTLNAKQEGLMRDLMVSAKDEMQHVDFTLLVIDAARRITDDLREALVTLMMRSTQTLGRVEATLDFDDDIIPPPQATPDKFAIVLNKVDLVNPKSDLLQVAEEVYQIAEAVLLEGTKAMKGEIIISDDGFQVKSGEKATAETMAEHFPDIFYISSLEKEGTDELLTYLLDRATPSHQWVIDANKSTSMSDIERVEEILREKIYRNLHREVPHQVKQVNQVFLMHERRGEKALQIDQDLVVRSKSHQRLVLGTSGLTLGRIREAAQRDLQDIFGCRVLLTLKVRLNNSQHDKPLEGTDLEF
jgi:GTP-binding protein Era